MVMKISLCEDGDEEEYIDMELSSSPSAESREFEFQMPTTSHHTHTTTSPADDLFYKGKLLPLYLPPRRKMLQNLLLTTTTPEDTCTNISPSESCRVSFELTSDDYFFEWSNDHPTKITWAQKLKLFKHSIQKLRASKDYLKSLFVKSHDISARKPLHPTIAAIMNINVEENSVQRRSFSSAIKRHSPTKCLSSSSSNSNSSSGSSSFSLNSTGLHDQLHCLRRSSSATEIEGSIEAAIAHCKSSHQSGIN